MRRITGRFVLLIATAAILPLVVYGLISVTSLRSGTEQSVGKGNQAVAQQVAAYIRQYFDNNLRVLTSIGMEIRGTHLEPWQQERILRNHVLDFREFREISVFDAGGRLQATSRVGPSTLTIPDSADLVGTGAQTYSIATPHEDADALPTTTIAVPVLGVGRSQLDCRGDLARGAVAHGRSHQGRHDGVRPVTGRALQAARPRKPERQGKDRQRHRGGEGGTRPRGGAPRGTTLNGAQAVQQRPWRKTARGRRSGREPALGRPGGTANRRTPSPSPWRSSASFSPPSDSRF